MSETSKRKPATEGQGKNSQKKRKKKNKKIAFLKLQLVFIAMFLVLLGVYFGSGLGGQINKLHADAVNLVHSSGEETFKASQTSVVYDVNENIISTLKGDKDVYYLDYDEIPDDVKTAFVSIEDKKFFKHPGVDFKAIVRAAVAYVKNGKVTQGGSTITQQLSRNMFLSHQVSWERKAEEIFISLELEKIYSKTKILEYYINNIYFANGYYGIEAASKGYFNKSVNELSLSQQAFLCAIPNNPTLYDPIDNLENTVKRRDRILKNMYEDGAITEEEYTQAKQETITLDVHEKEHQNYIETFIYNCATRELMQLDGFEFQYEFESDAERAEYEKRYDEAYAATQKLLYSNGYQIYTSINPDIQAQLQAAIDEQLSEFSDLSDEGIYKLQSAGTCINNSNGLVCAIVGGRSQDVTGYTLNRAYQSFRQPGSAIKPLVVYTPSLERGYTPDSTVHDVKEEDGPSNSGDSYEGSMSLRRAVAKSKNTVAWNLLKELTPKIGLSYLTSMEFSKIKDGDRNLSTALGGFTTGASSVEMAGGYATLANGGLYRSPTCIARIMDSDGNIIVNNENRGGKRVYKSNAVSMMTSMLQGVITEGTGRGLGLSNMACAGKTGTTNDNKDGWFVGYTPYYTTSIWVGYDMPQKVPGLSGSSYPGSIWHQFMENIHTGLEYKDFAVEEYEDDGIENDEPVEEPQEPQEPTDEAVEGDNQGEETPQEQPSATQEPTNTPVQTQAPTPTPTKTAEPTKTPTITDTPEPTTEPTTEPPQDDNPSPGNTRDNAQE